MAEFISYFKSNTYKNDLNRKLRSVMNKTNTCTKGSGKKRRETQKNRTGRTNDVTNTTSNKTKT